MSLINDALKKAQQQRAEETPAQPPVKDTISSPFNESQAPAQPASPPPPRRSPSPPSAIRYAPAEAVPEKRKISAVRYNPSNEEVDEKDTPGSRMPSAQRTFWVTLGIIAVAAIAVRVAVTLTRSSSEPTDKAKPSEQSTASGTTAPLSPPQISVPLPQPTLVMQPIAPPTTTKATQPEPAPTAKNPAEPEPTATVEFSPSPAPATTKAQVLPPVATSEQSPSASANTEPAPTVAFQPTSVPTTTKPATTPPVSESAPTPVVKTPPLPEPATATVSLPETKPAAAAVQPKPAPTVLPPIYTPRAPTPINSSARVQNFIDRLRVSGVRISSRGSKVILNDRLFSVGEVVDPTLDLKLVKIEEGVLTFTDSSGKNYLKLFQ